MERHNSGSRVARQREDCLCDALARVVLHGHGGEGGRFARLHVHAAEVDCTTERALDGRFEQVQLAHRHAAAGDHDVDFAECIAECFF